jgi:hypothetical protein
MTQSIRSRLRRLEVQPQAINWEKTVVNYDDLPHIGARVAEIASDPLCPFYPAAIELQEGNRARKQILKLSLPALELYELLSNEQIRILEATLAQQDSPQERFP